MVKPDTAMLQFRYADAAIRSTIVTKLNVPGRHRRSERTIHLDDDGFTIVEMKDAEPVGAISICWKVLPAPYSNITEAFIVLVDKGLRVVGIGCGKHFPVDGN